MQVSHTIHIDAPPERVWAVTVEVDRWPDWTPTVEHARRELDRPVEVGDAVVLKQRDLPETTWIVDELEPNRRFVWHTEMMGMHIVATHAIEPDADGSRCHLVLEASGRAAQLAWPVVKPRVEQMLEHENRGLKEYLESGSGAGA